jgi:hypothetical protein
MQQFENPLFQVHALSALDSGRVLLHQIYNIIYHPSFLMRPLAFSFQSACQQLRTCASQNKFAEGSVYSETTEPIYCRYREGTLRSGPSHCIR